MNKIYSILCLASLILFTQCKKDYLDRKPLSVLTEGNFYQTPQDAQMALTAAYGALQSPQMFGGAYYYYVDIASDDATFRDPSFTDHDQTYSFIDNFNWNGSTMGGTYSKFWGRSYEGVQRANMVLDRVPNIAMDETERNKILGQARFLRALWYFHLKMMFGEVPLFDKAPTTIEETYKPQASLDKINAFIEEDLKKAYEMLPARWDGNDVGRATKWAAQALLGKHYLYQQKWTLAKLALKDVIDNSSKVLLNDYNQVFSISNKNNEETIFEIQFKSGQITGQWGGFFIDGGIAGENNFRNVVYGNREFNSLGGFVIATKDLFNEFEPNDPRLKATLWTVGDTSFVFTDEVKGAAYSWAYHERMGRNLRLPSSKVGEFYNVKKFFPGQVGTSAQQKGIDDDAPNNAILIRLADVKLMYAEALVEEAQAVVPEAVTQLNDIRARARKSASALPEWPTSTRYGGNLVAISVNRNSPGKPNTTLLAPYYAGDTVTYSNFLDDFRKALVHERRVELAFEGFRYWDLIRWQQIPGHPGRAEAVFMSKVPARSMEDDKKTGFVPGLHKFFPKPQYEVDKSKGGVIQNY